MCIIKLKKKTGKKGQEKRDKKREKQSSKRSPHKNIKKERIGLTGLHTFSSSYGQSCVMGLARTSGIKLRGRGRGSIFERGVYFCNFFIKFSQNFNNFYKKYFITHKNKNY
jgi:hypothetical protein